MLRYYLLLIAAPFMVRRTEVYGEECLCGTPNPDKTALEDPRGFIMVQSPTEGGKSCIKDCVYYFSFIGKLNNEGTKAGWRVTFTTCDLGDGIIKLYDDFPADLNTAEPYEILDNSYCSSDMKAKYASSSNNFTIVLHNEKTPMNVGLFLQIEEAREVKSTPASTTTVATTTYSGPFDVDPSAVQLELAFIVDATATDTKESIRYFASNLSSYFDVHTDVSRASGVRLALELVTNSDGGIHFRSEWSYQKDDFASDFSMVPPLSGEPKYVTMLNHLLDNSFNPESSSSVCSRRNAQRVMLILASKDTKESDPESTVEKGMDNSDVHPVIINFGSDELMNLKKIVGENRLTVINYKDYTDVNSAVQDVLNSVLLNGDAVCKASQPKEENGVITIESPNFFGIPSGGKKGRYCNNQKTTFNVTSPKAPVTLTIKYELETEKDYLRIWGDNNKEYALFTGYNVKGSKMRINSMNVYIDFITDPKEVFGGFQINITSS